MLEALPILVAVVGLAFYTKDAKRRLILRSRVVALSRVGLLVKARRTVSDQRVASALRKFLDTVGGGLMFIGGMTVGAAATRPVVDVGWLHTGMGLAAAGFAVVVLVEGSNLYSVAKKSWGGATEPPSVPRPTITMEKFDEQREMTKPRVPDRAQAERYVDAGEALKAETISSLEEREAWNKRFDEWKTLVSEWLHDVHPEFAVAFNDAGKVQDELPIATWDAFDGHHNRLLILLDRLLRSLRRIVDINTEIAEAYQRGISRPKTQVTKLTTLKSLIGEWAETGVSNAKVLFIAADQFPLAREIASIFESWSPHWQITFYDTPQTSEWFEGIKVEGFVSALVNAVVDGLQTDVPHMPVEPIYRQVEIDAGNPKYPSVLKSVRVTVGYRPQGWSSEGVER